MGGRFWGLSRTQTLLMLAGVVLVSVVVALVLGPAGGDDDDERGADAAAVERIRPGTAGPADGVWAFGFETLRFDDRLAHPRQLAQRAFGTVLGTDGAVYLYDAGTGRIAVLDARRNRVRPIATIAPADGQVAPWAPTVALEGTVLWLVPSPGTVVGVDTVTGRITHEADLAAPASTATAVAAADGTVVTATRDRDAIAFHRIDPTSGAVTPGPALALPDAEATLDGLATDGTRAWVLAGQEVHTVDLSAGPTTTPPPPVPVPGQAPGDVRGLVEAAGALWTLGDGGAGLLRVDPATGSVQRAVRLLDTDPPAVRLPAALVTDGRHVYAMVQAGADPEDHTARIVGYDARQGRAMGGVDVPSRVLAGAIATT